MYHLFLHLTRAAVLLLLFHFPPAYATEVDPLIWEQFAAEADFIGTVECETAGGIVAKYRVIESWKGAPAGTIITIMVAVNYWEPQFPIALIGEQYLMAAFKSNALSRIMSMTDGNPVPLWLRNIPADYSLPLFQGRVLLPLKTGNQSLYRVGSDHADLNSLKVAIEKFLALSPDEREIRLLQRLSHKYLFDRRYVERGRNPAGLNALKKSIFDSTSVKEIVSTLLNFARKNSEKNEYAVRTILQQAGGATTLKILEETPAKQLPFDEPAYIIDRIHIRLGMPGIKTEKMAETNSLKNPSEAEITKMRQLLASNPTEEQFFKVFDIMTRYDPEPVADYLIRPRRVNAEKSWRDLDYGYVLGSYFAWHCGKNRAENFRKLLKAVDPFIRVAGALYLCFENRDEGMARLKELINVPGDAGVWAAINLARRGDKSAVPRVLEVFATEGVSNMFGVSHRNLQKRLLVLLSNSAGKSGLPQPAFSIDIPHHESESIRVEMQKKIYQNYLTWWDSNKDRVTLYDPWLTTLEQQKVD